MLLRAIVEVAFDPSALCVTAGHNAGPGFAQGIRLLAQFVQGGLQCRVELRVVKCETHLPGQVGEHTIVILGEEVVSRGPFDDDQSEELARVADGGHPELRLWAAVEKGRQPYRHPRAPRYPGPGHDRALPTCHDEGERA